jgi:hypothetical protein
MTREGTTAIVSLCALTTSEVAYGENSTRIHGRLRAIRTAGLATDTRNWARPEHVWLNSERPEASDQQAA